MTWGARYALAHRARPTPPRLGGLALGSIIYGITFPRWGLAVQTGAARKPGRRTPMMEPVALAVALTFGLATGFFHDLIRRNAPASLEGLPDGRTIEESPVSGEQSRGFAPNGSPVWEGGDPAYDSSIQRGKWARNVSR